METRMFGISAAALVATASIGLLPRIAPAALDPADASIINLYMLNEQSSGQLNNSVLGSFVDTAPSGTPQNHDDFFDGASDGPQWGDGALYMSGATTVGDGRGLAFTRSDNDNSRFQPWLGTSQGNYTPGKSYTVMARLYVTTAADGVPYNVLGHSSNYLQLEGVSAGTAARVDVRLREGAGGGETQWLFDSHGTGGSPTTGGNFALALNTWYNVFLIYEANAAVTLAADNGTTFQYLRTADVPASFDTLANGFADAGNHWGVGTYAPGSAPADPYDGRMESIVIWDKALTNAEADAINLTNVPEPAALSLLGLGALALRRRK